jgi:WD40 repeat protein
VWDTTDPMHPAQRAAFGSEEDASTTIAASGNHLIATGGTNKEMSLWDATDLTQPRRLAGIDGHRGGAITVDFDPSGEMLATSGADRTLKIWDVSAPAAPIQLAAIALGGVEPMRVRVLFDPGQPQLFVLDGTGTVRFWDTTAIDAVIRDPIHVACAVLAPGPVPAEWSGKLDARTAASAC